MCGISGILTNNHDLTPLIAQMQLALHHRGPDDQGIYISSDKNTALAHNRLSILDLSSAGHQPMSSGNNRYWITFNGEIYNFKEVRSQFLQDEKFTSQTDTEVILKLYQKMGVDCVKHFRGMFAFAIWDDVEKTCFIARDPLGIKPLYYYQSGNTLLFASEVKAILATKLVNFNLSVEGLYGYLTTGSVPEPYTMIHDIKSLLAGHYLTWKKDNFQISKYYQINFIPENINHLEAQEMVSKALKESIGYHFISDVPVGIFLSGGIDSSAVVALARKSQFGELRTYSIGFEESEWNEGEIAQKVAQNFDTKHTEYQITANIVKDLFPQFLQAIDQPSIDGFNTFCVSKIAHEDGIKVVLSGLGGDELFGGYASFYQIPKMVNFGQKFQLVKPVLNHIGKLLEYHSNNPKIKRLGDFFQQTPNTINAYRSFRGIFSHWEAINIINKYLPEQNIMRPDHISLSEKLPSIEDEISLLEITYYMRNQLLRDSDVMSMNWGLELRVPLVDRVLLETISSIPSNIRLKSGKELLVKSVPELPEFVYNRPKKGFIFPFEKWLNTELNDMFSDSQLNANIPVTSWYRKWSLGMLEYWVKTQNM